MRFFTAAIVSALAAVVCADTPANTTNPPAGNAIGHPGLNEPVPVGPGYTITWAPTLANCLIVDLILLKGPSNLAVPILTIADQIPNTGAYIWNVPTSLQSQATGYGIQLVCEGSGVYQYSTQFGISNPNGGASNPAGNGTAASGSITSTMSITTFVAGPTAPAVTGGRGASGTGNVTIPVLTPTKSMTVPSSLQTATGTAFSFASSSSGSAAASASSSSKSDAGRFIANVGGMVAVGLFAAIIV